MNVVKVYILDRRKWKYEEEEVLAEIAPYYADRYRRLAGKESAGKKRAWEELAAGYLLAVYLGVHEDCDWRKNEYGKPEFVSGKEYYNLSHSGDYVVLAVADCEVGVDVQMLRDYKETAAKRILSEAEQEMVKRLDNTGDDVGRLEVFARAWSRVEAALKLRGTGFAGEWDKSVVDECYIQTWQMEKYFFSVATMREVKTILIHVDEVK